MLELQLHMFASVGVPLWTPLVRADALSLLTRVSDHGEVSAGRLPLTEIWFAALRPCVPRVLMRCACDTWVSYTGRRQLVARFCSYLPEDRRSTLCELVSLVCVQHAA